MENTTGNIGVSYDDLLTAYRVCRQNKNGTANAVAFGLRYEQNLLRLRDEINARTYTLSMMSMAGARLTVPCCISGINNGR